MGIEQAYKTACSGCFDDIEVIVSSLEQKALQTAQPFADRVGIELTVNVGLGEHDRRNSGFLEGSEFNENLKTAFDDPEASPKRWETTGDALVRFKNALDEIDAKYEGKKILVVTHGTVLSLYFADQLGVQDQVYDRWTNLDNCDWGIVENGEIVRDIAPCN